MKTTSAVLLLLVSASANANSGTIQLPQDLQLNTSIERLSKAFQEIQKLPSIRSKLALSEQHSLVLRQRLEDEGIETTKFQQFFKGVEVVGSGAFHHQFAQDADVSNHFASFDLSIEPAVNAEAAVSIARGDAGDRRVKSIPQLKILPSEQDKARLVYYIKLEALGSDPGRQVIVDAHTGEIVASTSFHLTLAPVHVHSTTGRTEKLDASRVRSERDIPPALLEACQVTDTRSGEPLIINVKACEQVVVAGKASLNADAVAKAAASNATRVLTYFAAKHRRNSYDNAGGALTSLVHVGESFANAFWHSEEMYMGYGDGDGVTMGNLTRAVDVAGHEMTHGLIQNTAGLGHFGESGALNEAYADFFGVMISGKNQWQMGKDLAIIEGSATPIRDLQNPANLIADQRRDLQGRVVNVPYPAHKDDMFQADGPCGRSNDNCWVHVNATVPGHASYLVAKAIGALKAEKLYYRVLTNYLTETSTFASAAQATRTACAKMYDIVTCAKVNKAFETVGF